MDELAKSKVVAACEMHFEAQGIEVTEVKDLAELPSLLASTKKDYLTPALSPLRTVEAGGIVITLEDARERGTTLGSGVVMPFTSEIDMVDVLVRISQFFRDESCGQCVPCRVGTVRQNETMVVLQQKGSLTDERRQLVDDISQVMVDASICGLGHTAASAINSAIKLGLVPGVPA